MPRAIKEEHHVSIVQGGGAYDVVEVTCTKDAEQIIAEFKARFHDTELFHDKYAGGKFANYLLHRHDDKDRAFSQEGAHHLVEETNLFIEAAHACHGKILEMGSAAPLPEQSA